MLLFAQVSTMPNMLNSGEPLLRKQPTCIDKQPTAHSLRVHGHLINRGLTA